ncbi:hypothetical protein EVJ58_g11038 [Rhodofomes roseus]|uniref:Integrase catalytic domain-containing protein n=1 Tax=Rhodofomes roseus TaxID=34475 RepID=A0A4Y9XL96_9APHY|nr:hypothetical protein EVJ58_g11038 [Rhodofomes roseus]
MSEPGKLPSIRPQPKTISSIAIPSSMHAGGEILDRAKSNWFEWKAYVERSAKMCHLWPYFIGYVERPDPAVDSASAYNFDCNEMVAIAFLESKTNKEEQVFIQKNGPSLAAVWKALCQRHEKEPGAYAQATLIQELFSCRYVPTERYSVTSLRMQEIVDRIYNIGLPSADVMMTVAMLNAMAGHLKYLQSQVGTSLASSTPEMPYTSVDIFKRLDFEQQMSAVDAVPGVSDALAASAQSGRTTRMCSNPACPNPKGHLIDTCFAKGGGLEDKAKRDEYLASRRRGRQGKAKETAAAATTLNAPTSLAKSASVDSSGRPFVVDTSTGKVYFLSVDPPASASAQPDLDSDDFSELANVATAPDWVGAVATPADVQEYSALVSLTSEDKVSLNWSSHARATVDPSAYAVVPLPAASRRVSTVGSEPFVFDSGASTHLSPNRRDFHELRPIAPRGIRGIDGSVIHACGVGKVRLRIGRGACIVLDDVLYVPRATVRLISISALCRSVARYRVLFDDEGVSILTRGGAVVASGTLTGRRLYSLNGIPPSTEHALLSARLPTLDTWHRRLGHVNHRSIYDMARLRSAKGMPITLSPAPNKCEHCILGKQTRSVVPKVREGEKATRKLGLVYVDLQGQMDSRSANGNVYSLDIIDDHTSFSWTIPIPSKDAAEPRFEAWANAVETESGEKIRAVQIDNGELLSNDFKAFLARRGISLRLTAAYTSAHNGRVERLHRTLMDRARAMRLAANVPANRWDEFLLTANYLTVRTPSRSLPPGVTPYEAWHGRKPDLSHLREVGCRAFVLIQNKHNPKIYERSVECVLIGYGLNSKTYRCYHRASHKVVSSFHVAFIESHESSDATPAPVCPSRSGCRARR